MSVHEMQEIYLSQQVEPAAEQMAGCPHKTCITRHRQLWTMVRRLDQRVTGMQTFVFQSVGREDCQPPLSLQDTAATYATSCEA